MSIVKKLHDTAMEYAMQARISRAKGQPELAPIYFNYAFLFEKDAALKADNETDHLLPRYVLLRSAAALASKAGKYQEAEELITLSLSENPPAFIVEELIEIKEGIERKRKENGQPKPFKIKGIITAAHKKRQELVVETPDNQHVYNIHVAKEMMDEIVKSYWSTVVDIEGKQEGANTVVLEKIKLAA